MLNLEEETFSYQGCALSCLQNLVQMLLPSTPLKNLFTESLCLRFYSPVHASHYLTQAPFNLLCSCGAVVLYHGQSQPAEP